jgi:ankyrin repeat protein
MLERVKDFAWREVATSLSESPGLLDYRDDRGRNWLHLCCSVDPKKRPRGGSDSIKTADVLLAAGLDMNGAAFREGHWKATPVWYCVARGRNLGLLKHLLKLGADPNHSLWAAGFSDQLTAIKLLVAAGAELDAMTEAETPFLGAIKTSHFRSAQLLLEFGADVDFRDPRGMTALHCMLKKSSDAKHFRMLLKYGARGDIPDRDGRTAAEIMARKRAPEFRKLAAQLAADPSGAR